MATRFHPDHLNHHEHEVAYATAIGLAPEPRADDPFHLVNARGPVGQTSGAGDRKWPKLLAVPRLHVGFGAIETPTWRHLGAAEIDVMDLIKSSAAPSSLTTACCFQAMI